MHQLKLVILHRSLTLKLTMKLNLLLRYSLKQPMIQVSLQYLLMLMLELSQLVKYSLTMRFAMTFVSQCVALAKFQLSLHVKHCLEHSSMLLKLMYPMNFELRHFRQQHLRMMLILNVNHFVIGDVVKGSFHHHLQLLDLKHLRMT